MIIDYLIMQTDHDNLTTDSKIPIHSQHSFTIQELIKEHTVEPLI